MPNYALSHNTALRTVGCLLLSRLLCVTVRISSLSANKKTRRGLAAQHTQQHYMPIAP
jgi:hypothetical protein